MTVGVGSYVNNNELKTIAGSNFNFLKTNDYNTLDTILEPLRRIISNLTTNTNTGKGIDHVIFHCNGELGMIR